MLEEDVYIREAHPEEADVLSDLICASSERWMLPYGWGDFLRKDERIITQDFIEENPTYVLENEEEKAIVGFYTLEQHQKEWFLSTLCVSPDYTGRGWGGALFLHACEIAEGLGVEALSILSKEASEGFFCHMGAEKEEGAKLPSGSGGTLSVFKIRL